MENNKKMFTGFSKVFGFTAEQSVKGKGFKASTLILAIIIAVIFAGINIFMAAEQSNADAADDMSGITDIADIVENIDELDIYYVNKTSYDDGVMEWIKEMPFQKAINVYKVPADEEKEACDNTNKYLENDENAMLIIISENEEKISIKVILPDGTGVDEEMADSIGEAYRNYIDVYKVSDINEMTEKELKIYNADMFNQVLEAGEDPSDIGVFLAKLIVPMLFSLALYMMILTYGQNITKIVVSEKSSKLMETLLTSVKPYAIISGKILAVSSVAICQMLIWILSGTIGYIVGENIAKAINPDYTNYLSVIAGMIGEASEAFSLSAVIVAILMVIVGFLAYCVFAGLIAATVDKMEDISSVMALYQLPVIAGFLGAYLGPMAENNLLDTVIKYFPVTSPFYVPAQMIVGNMNVVEGVISLLIVLVVSFVLIIITGKIYKGKLFNRH